MKLNFDNDTYVMCVPTPQTFSCNSANNIWMKDLSELERKVEYGLAFQQFRTLYTFLCSSGMVYLLPPGLATFQDQVYVANTACVLPHMKEPTAVLSNFTATERRGEELPMSDLLSSIGFKVHQSPNKFEGEAELKHLFGNVYACSHGQRTEKSIHAWLAESFEAEIIDIELKNDRLYHLDCCLFPVSEKQILVCTNALSQSEILALEQHVEIIDVPLELAKGGVNNCIRTKNFILCSSDISSLNRNDEYYEIEKQKNRFLEDVCDRNGLELVLFNLSEFYKSGALLSCLVMHLSRNAYATPKPTFF